MAKLRIHPKAVCRQLIIAIEDQHKPLTGTEDREVIHAIKTTGISLERVLASLSRGALKSIMEKI